MWRYENQEEDVTLGPLNEVVCISAGTLAKAYAAIDVAAQAFTFKVQC